MRPLLFKRKITDIADIRVLQFTGQGMKSVGLNNDIKIMVLNAGFNNCLRDALNQRLV